MMDCHKTKKSTTFNPFSFLICLSASLYLASQTYTSLSATPTGRPAIFKKLIKTSVITTSNVATTSLTVDVIFQYKHSTSSYDTVKRICIMYRAQQKFVNKECSRGKMVCFKRMDKPWTTKPRVATIKKVEINLTYTVARRQSKNQYKFTKLNYKLQPAIKPLAMNMITCKDQLHSWTQ